MIKVLVLCDDTWHPGEVVERGLSDFPDKEFEFDIVKDAKDILTKEMIAEYPVIMNCKSDNLALGNPAPWFEDGVTEVGPEELEEYVRNGGGFLSVHAANTSSKERCPKYAAFVGNCFVTHPPRCQVEVEVVKEHPVADGVENFSVRDEHYQLSDIAPDADVFLESVSESGGRQTAGYTRMMGEGRLCVLTPGHIVAVWKNEMYQKLLSNALHWCCRKD